MRRLTSQPTVDKLIELIFKLDSQVNFELTYLHH